MASANDKSQTRAYNFSPGPAALPLPVLQRAQQELLCLPGAGASVLELSHRGSHFTAILESAIRNLKQLLSIPDDYRILFLQGGARLQFSMIPMNLLRDSGRPADYVLTGSWSKKAIEEARKEGETRVVWDGKPSGYNHVPDSTELNWSADAAYAYITSNETIEGVQFATEPETGAIPLVCDASSDFLHKPIEIRKYGLLFACAQKNAGPAGVTIVIIREDLLDRSRESLPGYLNFQLHAKDNSLYNTPPTFAIYLVDLVTQWLLHDIGGLAAMHELNKKKAELLYHVIDDSSGYYLGHAQPQSRSIMNVTFRLPSDELQSKFLAQAQQRDLHSLKGHRSVGGIRASIYNAMTWDGVVALRDFLCEFRDQNPH
jgi:phosphoserine aminotransferase